MIKRIIQNLIILRENLYNINETRIMLNMFNSIKVFVNKNDLREYKDVNVKQTMIFVIKCVSADDKSLFFLII